VRFASVNEEIEPENSLEPLDSAPPTQEITNSKDATIKELTKTLQGSHLQERRMSHFAFEPVSLPVSRVRYFNYDDIRHWDFKKGFACEREVKVSNSRASLEWRSPTTFPMLSALDSTAMG
jgi:hypothetical protein